MQSTKIFFLFRIHGHMSSVRIQHDVYAQVLVNHVYDADILPRIKANTGLKFFPIGINSYRRFI